MISFIVPAHNEEAWVGRCLSAIHNSMESVGEPHEVIVVDDASTDATALVAEQNGARISRVEHRQISPTRNAGARQTLGDILFFVDADTLVNAPVIQSALRSIRAGAVGGGCLPNFDGWMPLGFRLGYPLAKCLFRCLRLTGGAFMFCTRSAFEMTGGFNEKLYAAEEVPFIKALKRQGSFVVLAETVVTSGRSFRAHSVLSLVRIIARLAFRGPDDFRDRRGLDSWYHPDRKKQSAYDRLA
jgi:glycosyltransferase involved in cell wall biosynthesis